MAWRALLVLASMLTAAFATYYSPSEPPGDYDPRVGPDMHASAHFQMAGILGDISFYQPERGANVEITVELQNLDQFFPQSFRWPIREYPIAFGHHPRFPCADLGAIYAPINCSTSESVNCVYGDLSERLGPIRSTERIQVFSDDVLDLYGPNTPIGRSIVIERETAISCANIRYTGISLQTLRAGFDAPELSGEVILRRQNGKPGMTFHVELNVGCDVINPGLGPLSWSLHRGGWSPTGVGTCQNRREAIFGSETHEDEIHHGLFDACSRQNPRECFIGDLNSKCGMLSLFETQTRRYRAFCNDDQLGLVPVSTITTTVLVIRSESQNLTFCAPWEPIRQHCARVTCTKRPRIHMDILFFQNDPHDLTHIRSHITGLDGIAAYLQVRSRPVDEDKNCTVGGGLYDVDQGPGTVRIAAAFPEPAGISLGTLSGRITDIRGKTSLRTQNVSPWVPLFGPFSIVGRSIAIVSENGDDLLCCNIEAMSDPSPELIRSILGYQEQSNIID